MKSSKKYDIIGNRQKAVYKRIHRIRVIQYQIDMSWDFSQLLPTYQENPFIQNEGITMGDYMAAHFLSNDLGQTYGGNFLDISEYCVTSLEPSSSQSLDEEWKEYNDKEPQVCTLDKSVSLEMDEEQGPAQTQEKCQRGRQRSPPKRDYVKNITKNVVQSCCREFRKDLRCQKIIKRKCKLFKVSYQEFMELIKDIMKEYHISNYILLTKYLAPPETDPQFTLKKFFAEYFRYFLRYSLLRVILTSPKIKDHQAYISYSNKYLLNLDTNSVSQDIFQNKRI